MLDPSNGTPSANKDSFSSCAGTLKCCHDPGRSVNLKSTILTPFSLANFTTSSGVMCLYSPLTFIKTGRENHEIFRFVDESPGLLLPDQEKSRPIDPKNAACAGDAYLL